MFVPVKDKLDKLVALTPDDQEKLSHYKSIVPAMIANCHKAHQTIPGYESCKPEIEAFKWFDGINIPVHGYIDLKGDKVIIQSDDLDGEIQATVKRIGNHINELTQSIDVFIEVESVRHSNAHRHTRETPNRHSRKALRAVGHLEIPVVPRP